MFPSSSLRGFVTATACLGRVVESARRWLREVASLGNDRKAELGDLGDCHDGARKSRNSGCCGCVVDVLKVRLDAAGAHARCAFVGVESARRHLLDAFIVVDMITMVRSWCCVLRGACFAFSSRLVMR
jgi:hypothetical protein